ncbi:MAG: NAD(P)/FAD-dependent oxidoreductase [Lachnospiraceae bacterium]|jgi:glycerol-3-phosphate dehydrogenase|nr:NAD(P)/FAD-dependent oxidoreductase [Lachnospiraceae bacterium]
MYDVVIIGAGVSGSAIARELSRYKVNVLVLEKNEDVCSGTSKANSGIVHAGHDATPGSLMAKLNVEGSQMMEELSKELDFAYERNGSMILCFDKKDFNKLQDLYDNGIKNGVKNMEIIYKDEIKKLEPNLTDNVYAALYSKDGGIVDPFGLNIAMAENAATNGVKFEFNAPVVKIEKGNGYWAIDTDKEIIKTKCIVNAAGVFADTIHNMVSKDKMEIIPRKGEYYLLDKSIGKFTNATIFQLPTAYGKGILITPTAHGNMLIGPTANDIPDKEGTNTTREGLDEVALKSMVSSEIVPLRKVITSFAGLRAHLKSHDFVIEEVEGCDGFFDAAGIESPGLTSSPAIGKMVGEMIQKKLHLEENPEFDGKRKDILNPKNLTEEEYEELIKEKPAYGHVICRCERVTEGEILDAIHRPLGAKSLDGIKRRTRAGSGRCQAGFCSPRVMEILSRELNIDQSEITKSGGDSKIIFGTDKDAYRRAN